MENPNQERILELMVLIDMDKMSYLKNIESYNIFEIEYTYLIIESISKYNSALCISLRRFIIDLKKTPFDFTISKIKKMKEYESEFLKLLRDLLTDNFLNIKYDFTKFILVHFNREIIIKYLDEHSLLYLLPRINPDKFYFFGPEQEEFIRNFCHRQTCLKLAWFGTVIRASYFGPS